MPGFTVGYFVGSLATKSINRLLAKALVKLAPADLHMTEIPFKDLPLYSYDYDANYPPVATEFKNAIAAVDAVLFVTPEYNRSIPGGLKNAIDWASRPYGKNSFTRKPSAVHRDVAWKDWNSGRATTPAQHSGVLQFAADELDRGLHPVRARPHHARTGRSTTNRHGSSSRTTWWSSTGSSRVFIQCCRAMPDARPDGLVTSRFIFRSERAQCGGTNG